MSRAHEQLRDARSSSRDRHPRRRLDLGHATRAAADFPSTIAPTGSPSHRLLPCHTERRTTEADAGHPFRLTVTSTSATAARRRPHRDDRTIDITTPGKPSPPGSSRRPVAASRPAFPSLRSRTGMPPSSRIDQSPHPSRDHRHVCANVWKHSAFHRPRARRTLTARDLSLTRFSQPRAATQSSAASAMGRREPRRGRLDGSCVIAWATKHGHPRPTGNDQRNELGALAQTSLEGDHAWAFANLGLWSIRASTLGLFCRRPTHTSRRRRRAARRAQGASRVRILSSENRHGSIASMHSWGVRHRLRGERAATVAGLQARAGRPAARLRWHAGTVSQFSSQLSNSEGVL